MAFSILDLIREAGLDDTKVQFLSACMTNAKTVKGGARITFDTTEVSVTGLATNRPEAIGVIVWFTPGGFAKAQAVANK